MTVAWNTIPGETPIDISDLKISGVNNRQELSVVEAENVRKAIVKYLGGSLTRRIAKFDLPWMLKLHREMFGDVWKWAGEVRTADLNRGSPWHQVTAQLHNLCADLTHWETHWPDVVEQAAHLHHHSLGHRHAYLIASRLARDQLEVGVREIAPAGVVDLRRPPGHVPVLARVVRLIEGRAEEHARRMHELAQRENDHQDRDQR